MKIFEKDGLEHLWNRIKNLFLTKEEFFNSVYPVGSIYISTSSTNPNTIHGFGTWQIWGVDRTIIGVDENDEDFTTPELTGGESTHTLTLDELPRHNHGIISLTGSVTEIAKQNSSTQISANGIFSIRSSDEAQGYGESSHNIGYDGFNCDATHTHTSIGSGQAHNNMQPYELCYMWKRIQ